ncbi:hypothetical protein jhhlp_004076 [Lomentospora prolificans]|uniref:HhH-GPD domain-containing protein n=1 Tax=Lomentospora prolificans TaxID=41688 RepID=A0A2N3NAK0_9PEZI|nr:hypothetical protein jhhlp_004076 [Lomentospora prolificans]
MRTRSAARKCEQGENRTIDSPHEIEEKRPRKRARFKGPAQPVRRGWEVLPHNLKSAQQPVSGDARLGAVKDGQVFSGLDTLTRVPSTDTSLDEDESTPCQLQSNPQVQFSSKAEDVPSVQIAPLSLDEPNGKNGVPAAPKRMRRKTKDNPYGLLFGRTPFPHWQSPSPEECEVVHQLLTELHGEAKAPSTIPSPSLTVAGCGEVPSVLDALLRTLLSAATTMKAANEAFNALVKKYGIVETEVGVASVDWGKVRLSSVQELAVTIKRAGLANGKAADIKKILDMVWDERGELSLDHLHSKSASEAMNELVRYPRIGVKTAACVILFCLQVPCFAVDTHVHRLCKWLRWVPQTASSELTFWHCEYLVPDHLKYGLHQLFIRHGQTCDRCRANTAVGTEGWEAATCVLEHLLERNKPKRSPRRTSKPKVGNNSRNSPSKKNGDGTEEERAMMV